MGGRAGKALDDFSLLEAFYTQYHDSALELATPMIMSQVMNCIACLEDLGSMEEMGC